MDRNRCTRHGRIYKHLAKAYKIEIIGKRFNWYNFPQTVLIIYEAVTFENGTGQASAPATNFCAKMKSYERREGKFTMQMMRKFRDSQ